jgi:hypothetical protein
MAAEEGEKSASYKKRIASLWGAVLNDVGSSIVDFLLFPADLVWFHTALDSSLRPLLKTALGNNETLSNLVHKSSASAFWTGRSGGVVRSVVFERRATDREVIEVAEACPALQVVNHLSYLYTLPSLGSLFLTVFLSLFCLLGSPLLFPVLSTPLSSPPV